LLASVRPDAIRAAVLNDIGPVIEKAGLLRIKGYVGKLPAPGNYEDAAIILRGVFGPQFPALGDADWLAAAHRTFRMEHGRLVPTYDVRIADTLKDVTPDSPLADLWPQFDALAGVPVMVVRGALSDLLSPATVVAMKARRPDMHVVEVPDQGHAPWLEDEATLAAIDRFLAPL